MRSASACGWTDNASAFRVVGIVGGVWKHSALKRDKMVVYVPLAQSPDIVSGALVVRARGTSVAPFIGQLRRIVQGVQPSLPAADVSLARDMVGWEFRPWRLGATLLSSFALFSLFVAAAGLYGVVSFSLELSRKAIGICRAMGAQWYQLLLPVAGASLGAVAAGIGIGTGTAALTSKWIQRFLYGTSALNPLIFMSSAAVLLFAAALAAAGPMARTLASNAMLDLRAD